MKNPEHPQATEWHFSRYFADIHYYFNEKWYRKLNFLLLSQNIKMILDKLIAEDINHPHNVK